MVAEREFVNPGKGSAFVRLKLKNLITGQVLKQTIKSQEMVEDVEVVVRNFQYLYLDTENYHFMDTESYEQLFLNEDQLGTSKNYLQENVVVKMLFYNGQPIGVDVPIFVELAITETDPGVRGDTALYKLPNKR